MAHELLEVGHRRPVDGSRADDAARIRLSLLGGFRLEAVGRVRELPTGAQRLLAFLGIRGPTSRAAVAGTLWPAVAEDRALASLRTAVWRLRGMALDDDGLGLVTAHGDRLTLSAAVDVDLDALRGRAVRLLTAQPLLEDDLELDGPAGAELLPGWYDDWVLFERERLRQLWLHALEALSALLAERQRYAEALEAALAAVRSEPLRESANRAVLAVHLAEGNVVEALRHYELFRGLLRSELQVEPSERLMAMVSAWAPGGVIVRGCRAPSGAGAGAGAGAGTGRTVRQATSPGPAQATSHSSHRQLKYR
jgi:DNA-binding SARP family transcriptional activator